ncbi:MAG: hypothetical protein ABIV94_11685 [Acidimicrobiales bacterium]
MSRIAVVVTALGLLVLLAPPARAVTKTVTITQAGTTVKVAPDPVRIAEGDTVTFANQTPFSYTVCATATSAGLVTVPANGTQPTASLAEQELEYYIVMASCASDADMAHGSIEVGPAPTTTTEAATTTTAIPITVPTTTTTTTAPEPSTTTSTTSTTTSTTSTTSTTVAPTVTATGTGKGGGTGTALLLGAAVVVVAGLATAAFVAYRRSDLSPYDGPDDESGTGGWTDGPPPTQIGPTS